MLTDANSGLLWVESHSSSKFTDWVTALTIDLIDQASRLKQNTVLRYFYQSQQVGQGASTAMVVLQSLIFQIIMKHSQDLAASQNQILKNQFSDSKNDFKRLWQLFLDILEASKIPCLWIMIDHVGFSKQTSKRDPDMSKLLSCLDGLACSKHVVAKVLITARLIGKRQSSEILDGTPLSRQHSIISMPRGSRMRAHTPVGKCKAQSPAATPVPKKRIEQSPSGLKLSAIDWIDGSSAHSTDSERPANPRIRAIQRIQKTQKQHEDTDHSEYDLPGKDLWAGTSSEDISSDDADQRSNHSTSSEDSLDEISPMHEKPEPFNAFTDAFDADELRQEQGWDGGSPITPRIKIDIAEYSPKSSDSRPLTPADEIVNAGRTETKALSLQPLAAIDEKRLDIGLEKITANDSDDSDASDYFGL